MCMYRFNYINLELQQCVDSINSWLFYCVRSCSEQSEKTDFRIGDSILIFT